MHNKYPKMTMLCIFYCTLEIASRKLHRELKLFTKSTSDVTAITLLQTLCNSKHETKIPSSYNTTEQNTTEINLQSHTLDQLGVGKKVCNYAVTCGELNDSKHASNNMHAAFCPISPCYYSDLLLYIC